MAAQNGSTRKPSNRWILAAAGLWAAVLYLAMALWPGSDNLSRHEANAHVVALTLGIRDYMLAPLPGAEEAAPAHIPLALGFSEYRSAPVPGDRDDWDDYVAAALRPLHSSAYVGAPLSRALGRWEEIECLALTIYFEARGESSAGQRAVGDVVMNRVHDPAFPGTVCGVTRQGGERVRSGCQFSWWCDGRSDQPRDMKAWRASYDMALQVYWDRSRDETDGALWYHADYVAPRWRKAFEAGPQIGRHLFYRRPGEASTEARAAGPAEAPQLAGESWAF